MNILPQLALCILSWIAQDCAGKTILTTTGLVKGLTKKGLNVTAYLGIPYAEPPINKLRFEKPLQKKPWKGVYRAEYLPPSCMQNNSGNYFEPSSDMPMSEDCLYLNLWVPDSKDKGLKAVMVFIHGGAFTIGSSNMKLYDGTNLAKKGDVIVASMNFRVGAFGFLLLEGGGSNGNMAIFDQIMALKWIKDNARVFGGDPDNIVLFGESSGSACVGLFMLSPLTRNLFRRAIMQSGAPVHPMGLYNNAQVSLVSRKIVRLSGCANKTKDLPKNAVSCMKSLPAKTIADAEGELKATPFSVLMRTHDDILPSDIPQMLTDGNFTDSELLIGSNEAEGAFFLSVAAPDYFRDGRLNLSSKSLARRLLRMILTAIGLSKEADEVSSYYIDVFGNGTSASHSKALESTLGDYYINCGSYYHSEFMSLKNPVYYYVMKHRPASTPHRWTKMTHFDELQYVFGNPLFKRFTPEEQAFSDKIIRRWVAFAKYGSPNVPGEVAWPRFHREDPKYMVLSEKEDKVQSGRPDDSRCEIWRKKFQTIVTKEVLAKFNARTDMESVLAPNS